ncbi:glycoside hydrolase family 2 TIM barrel-domain containing protein [uncultured Lactobacillus sp.]|uniref:glycoside hydrolase family 2 TIM barrel-domain containing protein n=1 Tax=uncultured Lactobacillus sp. TaxID=153152 RepID=UPI00258A3456|nr:glycoside hydrolase family 2 TIM barrel-domain containing protein [uncultured Lactobacillus sp.]
MRQNINLNKNWQFHQGEIDKPNFLSRKSYSLGGLTAPLSNENGKIISVSVGGEHFLKLIAQGNVKVGLRNLAGTKLIDQLNDSWINVNLPDDWKRRVPYQNDPAKSMSGYKPDGVAYYRKNFKLETKYDSNVDQKYILHFNGIMQSSDIWMNGAYLGHNESGYTSIDLDVSSVIKFAEDGDNVILVRTDTTTGSEGWWYEGAGIYKNVWLEVYNPVHLDADSINVRTLELDENKAKLQVKFSVINDTEKKIRLEPKFEITENVQESFDQVEIEPSSKHKFIKEFQINDPKAWTPEHPYLYQIKISTESDEIRKSFGIHTFSYDTKGFILNGKRYQLRGVCEHQDFGGVGIALNQGIIDYKINVLKKMGVNALRSSHHFASKELLDACDRYGIIVINENRLLEATPWRLNDLKKMVKKSRYHACIAFWSIANEEIVGNTKYAERSVKQITQIIRSLDPDKLLISAELLNPEGKVDDNYLKYFDILGVNYPEAGVMGNGAEIIHQEHPNLPMMSTENASYFSTRGIYKDNGNKCWCNNFGSMYSMVLPGKRKPGDPGVGGTAHPERVMEYLNSHPYMGGVFLWTGLDYYGEPSPFSWPEISSQFGICDLGGLPKDYYYYYQAHWSKEPVLHLMPHWNEDGLQIIDGQVNVRVFSNVDEVELFVNDVSQGRQKVQEYENNWTVEYQSGELKVKGYKGNKVIEDSYVTTQKTDSVQITQLYSSHNTYIYELKAVDHEGVLVPTANDKVNINTTDGEIIGLTNGDPSDNSEYSLSEIKLFSGKAVVVVNADKTPKIKVSLR